MASPGPTPINIASILNDPALTSMGYGDLTYYLDNPGFDSLVSSIVDDYMSIFSGLSFSLYTDSPTPTADDGNPVETGAQVTGAANGGARPGNGANVVATPPPTPTAGQSSPDTANASGSSSDSSSPPIGPIVGGVVGGVTALILAAVLLYCCCRQRKGMTERDFLIDGEEHPHHVEPYAPRPPMTQFASHASHASHPSFDSSIPTQALKDGMISPAASSSLGPPTPSLVDTKTSLMPPPSLSGLSRSSTERNSLPSLPPLPSPPLPFPPSSSQSQSHAYPQWNDTVVEHAVDAGSLGAPVPPRKEVLPPMYDPNWSASRDGPS